MWSQQRSTVQNGRTDTKAGGDYRDTSKSGGIYFIGAQTSINNPNDALSITFKPAIETFTLAKYGQYSAPYTTPAHDYLSLLSGTLSITEMDTNCFIRCKLKGTFSIITDTVNGQYKKVTDGVIQYTRN